MKPPTRKFRVLLVSTIVFGVLTIGSPLVGLLGTVGGMSKSFKELGNSGVAEPNDVSAGISEALVSTASGLAVAVVALLFSIVLFVLTIIEYLRLKKAERAQSEGA
jgi:biopolymer transport protein ExbB